MIALKITLNGKQVCVAGADDLSVLNAIISATGRLGKKTVPARPDETGGDFFYSVGGLTSRPNPAKDIHMNWQHVAPLNELGSPPTRARGSAWVTT